MLHFINDRSYISGEVYAIAVLTGYEGEVSNYFMPEPEMLIRVCN